MPDRRDAAALAAAGAAAPDRLHLLRRHRRRPGALAATVAAGGTDRAPAGAAAARPNGPSPIPTARSSTSSSELSDDLRTVTGTQTVAFTPDPATDELVFRLLPNAPDSAPAGNG